MLLYDLLHVLLVNVGCQNVAMLFFRLQSELMHDVLDVFFDLLVHWNTRGMIPILPATLSDSLLASQYFLLFLPALPFLQIIPVLFQASHIQSLHRLQMLFISLSISLIQILHIVIWILLLYDRASFQNGRLLRVRCVIGIIRWRGLFKERRSLDYDERGSSVT